jgi:hypothetical protein
MVVVAAADELSDEDAALALSLADALALEDALEAALEDALAFVLALVAALEDALEPLALVAAFEDALEQLHPAITSVAATADTAKRTMIRLDIANTPSFSSCNILLVYCSRVRLTSR